MSSGDSSEEESSDNDSDESEAPVAEGSGRHAPNQSDDSSSYEDSGNESDDSAGDEGSGGDSADEEADDKVPKDAVLVEVRHIKQAVKNTPSILNYLDRYEQLLERAEQRPDILDNKPFVIIKTANNAFILPLLKSLHKMQRPKKNEPTLWCTAGYHRKKCPFGCKIGVLPPGRFMQVKFNVVQHCKRAGQHFFSHNSFRPKVDDDEDEDLCETCETDSEESEDCAMTREQVVNFIADNISRLSIFVQCEGNRSFQHPEPPKGFPETIKKGHADAPLAYHFRPDVRKSVSVVNDGRSLRFFVRPTTGMVHPTGWVTLDIMGDSFLPTDLTSPKSVPVTVIKAAREIKRFNEQLADHDKQGVSVNEFVRIWLHSEPNGSSTVHTCQRCALAASALADAHAEAANSVEENPGVAASPVEEDSEAAAASPVEEDSEAAAVSPVEADSVVSPVEEDSGAAAAALDDDWPDDNALQAACLDAEKEYQENAKRRSEENRIKALRVRLHSCLDTFLPEAPAEKKAKLLKTLGEEKTGDELAKIIDVLT